MVGYDEHHCGFVDNYNEFICNNCIDDDEYQRIYHGLFRGLSIKQMFLGDDIMNIIIEYTIGYILTCCNPSCSSTILIDNRRSLLYMQKKNKWYEIKYIKQFNYKIQRVDGMNIRIFCDDCRIYKCQCCHVCKNRDCSMIRVSADIYPSICKAHFICECKEIFSEIDYGFEWDFCEFCYQQYCETAYKRMAS